MPQINKYYLYKVDVKFVFRYKFLSIVTFKLAEINNYFFVLKQSVNNTHALIDFTYSVITHRRGKNQISRARFKTIQLKFFN